MLLKECYTMSNGVKIPKIGLGTWCMSNEEAKQAVVDAVKLGYRHIDTAQAYENEVGVGEGIKACGVPREELFIMTKVRAEIKDYETAVKSIDESLERLGVSYIDMIIIHCPQPWNEFRGEKRYFKENKKVWKALEEAYKDGKVKAIGVSNFLIDDLENIFADCEIKPMINQVQTHIGSTPFKLHEFCKQNDILIESYSPMAHGRILNDERIKQVADKYGVSVATLCVRYTLQLETVSLPKTTNPDHMKANTEVDFVISDEDMKLLIEMNESNE